MKKQLALDMHEATVSMCLPLIIIANTCTFVTWLPALQKGSQEAPRIFDYCRFANLQHMRCSLVCMSRENNKFIWSLLTLPPGGCVAVGP